jgi:hypothetical protein
MTTETRPVRVSRMAVASFALGVLAIGCAVAAAAQDWPLLAFVVPVLGVVAIALAVAAHVQVRRGKAGGAKLVELGIASALCGVLVLALLPAI